jgi:murein DD-endopeptidase MepM/ murein hydrolase activator NlpD
MTLHNKFVGHLRMRCHAAARHACDCAAQRPALTLVLLLAAGVALGAGLRTGAAGARLAWLEGRTAAQQVQLAETRDQAQREVNALAARLGELQAQANRLNALGERLAQAGKFDDGEFDFDAPVGIGGAGPASDMPVAELDAGIRQLDARFKASGAKLSVLESLLFNRRLEQAATPTRSPIANSYITSGFGRRADPFGRGGEYHKGLDFHARIGDPVTAVADGVVSYAGVRS